MSADSGVVHFIAPAGLRDATRPSGGNNYDLELIQELPDAGWQAHLHEVSGAWPQPDEAAQSRLSGVLAALPQDSTVLLDGLVACSAPGVLEPESDRLHLVILVHLPLADETGLSPEAAEALDAGERRALGCAASVITVSEYLTRRLISDHGLPLDRVHTAVPGVRIVQPARGTNDASELLCVASITPRKGHLVLVEALASLVDLPWRCRFVGGTAQDPAHVARVRDTIAQHGLTDRITVDGPLVGDKLHAAYTESDVAVLASHAEQRPLVIGDALGYGLPVVATDVGAVSEILGRDTRGAWPGLLVSPGRSDPLANALRSWLTDAALRDALRKAADTRRSSLPFWHATAQVVARALRGERASHPTGPSKYAPPYPWPPANAHPRWPTVTVHPWPPTRSDI